MPYIKITVRDKVATGDRSRIVCGNSDYIAIFDFDAEWDPYDTKTARFVYAEHSGQYVDVVFTGTECPVPVIQDVIGVTVGVFAGDLHTTTPAWFECDKSILCGGGSPAAPPDDVYNQIMERLNKLVTPEAEAIAAAVADYIAANPIAEKDPTVPGWAKAPTKPGYTASEVGADSSGTAASLVTAHNTGADTHNDIRLLIQGLTDRLNALADSDDTTLDQLSEIVAYIKSNRDLIAAVTTDKVSVGDIVNDLVTNAANKPISAAQGVALKALVDSLSEEIANLDGGADVSVEPAEDDIPKVFFGGSLQQTKDAAVVPFRYISKTQDIVGYAEIKAQGNSSMSYPKKNQTVKLFKDADCTEKLKVDFKGWGKQNKHVYKANWIDLSHARNVVSARLWADTVKSRSNYDELPEELRTSPNQGVVDGFPVKVYANGIYQGRYTLNIPKDKWMANMDDALDTHCILCGENYVSGCFRASAKIDGTDWTDEIHDTVPDSIKARWNEAISFVMNSTDAEFQANLGNYFDIASLIDYHLFGLASCGLDAYGKNQLYMTYDGQKWIACMYDMDSTWGLYWNGSSFVATDYARTSYEDMKNGDGNLLYIRLEQLFCAELQSRWAELKAGPLSIDNIINRFERFTDISPSDLVKEDYASTTGGGAFTGIPSQSTNNIQQIRSYALERQAWCDEYIAGLTPVEEIPCTGISLSVETLTFTGTGTQTLAAALEPDGCTDEVTWESSDTSVATVSGGVVAAVANGECVITAICGDYSASCSVSVEGIGSEVVSLVYSLPEATTFDGSNYIDTGIQLFAEDTPFTVMVDWEHTGANDFMPNSGSIIHCMNEISPYIGIVMQYHAMGIQLEVNQSNKLTKLSKSNDLINNYDLSNIRVVFRKDSSGMLTISRMYNHSGGVLTDSIQGVYTAITQNLLLGCYQTNAGEKGRYAKGIMNDCKVYNFALSDEEIDTWLNA